MPNGPTGDPALWVEVPDEGHAILLDLGDLSAISNRKLMRVDRVIVTHTHMDHFIGFDALLRLILRRERPLTITGPPGFIERVRNRIGGYTWNLIGSYPIQLIAEEAAGDRLRSVTLSGRGGLRPEASTERRFAGVVHTHRSYSISIEELDHGTPVLGVALKENRQLNVDRDRLVRLGFTPGPWLAELKQAIREGKPGDTPVDAERSDGTTVRLACAKIAGQIIDVRPGEKLGYLTDFVATADNLDRALALVRGADLLVCEAVFLHEDATLARERFHLTARQAGELARAAGVRKLAPFHFSPRYSGRTDRLIEEAAAAFGGEVVELPRGPMV